jgi:Fe-S-cluster-containing hydrogenase component 2
VRTVASAYPLGYYLVGIQPEAMPADYLRTQNMTTVTIDQARCDRQPGCPARRSCPKAAIVPYQGGYTVTEEKCTGCGVCMRVCPMSAISFR